MTTTTTEPIRKRFRTLDSACQHIEALEGQIVTLNAALASRATAPAKAQTPAPPVNQQNAPATTQRPVSLPAVERPLAELSKRELADLMDAANASGDKATTDKLWREYRTRK